MDESSEVITNENLVAFPTYSRRLALYLVVLLAVPVTYYYFLNTTGLPLWLSKFKLLNECILFGLIGGCIYCLRGIYINHCVQKQWCGSWALWYLLRPLVSTVMGGISYFVLMSGLMAIGISGSIKSPDHFFYLAAFFAGLRVDSFLKHFEGQISKRIGSNEQNK
ncbi:hypothetical protein [Aeromonas salmonicida]|uniref:hypothetical protein n=1 Tax=Aeromonas salmonicida TaxID=645 RepID=UPI001CECA6B9|nr:hypothetical protein [Aeromonas salmonicida]